MFSSYIEMKIWLFQSTYIKKKKHMTKPASADVCSSDIFHTAETVIFSEGLVKITVVHRFLDSSNSDQGLQEQCSALYAVLNPSRAEAVSPPVNCLQHMSQN